MKTSTSEVYDAEGTRSACGCEIKDGIDGRRRGAVVLKMKSVYHERTVEETQGSRARRAGANDSMHRIIR